MGISLNLFIYFSLIVSQVLTIYLNNSWVASWNQPVPVGYEESWLWPVWGSYTQS